MKTQLQQPGPLETSIRAKLESAFAPELLAIENESHQHSGPAMESHFKVLMVSPAFEGVSRIERSRRVHEVVAVELKGGVHALTQRLMTPAEYAKQGAEGFVSPACMGGSKRELRGK
jgi:BolA protein